MRTNIGISHLETTDDLRWALLMEDGGENLMGESESEQETRKWRQFEDNIFQDALLWIGVWSGVWNQKVVCLRLKTQNILVCWWSREIEIKGEWELQKWSQWRRQEGLGWGFSSWKSTLISSRQHVLLQQKSGKSTERGWSVALSGWTNTWIYQLLFHT